MSFVMDKAPNEIMRMVQLGLEEEIANSKTIWFCASCLTCTVRCPKGVDISRVMEALRLITLRKNVDFVAPSGIPPEAVAELPQIALVSGFRNLKVAAYYGCTLLRPQEAAIDRMERPTVLQDLMSTIGASAIDFPFATECCGSFQTVSNPEFVAERAHAILGFALRRGADAVVVSCPLCDFNLGKRQIELRQKYSDFQGIPIIYFTQLLALSLGVDPDICRFDLNFGEPEAMLKNKGFIS
jgi:Fe-S oxidoreductase